jgi:SulP family sulfate permease
VARQVGDTHWQTLAMGVTAIVIMYVIRKKAPKLPGVLIAVAVTTIASWLLHFENNVAGKVDQIADAELKTLVQRVDTVGRRLDFAVQELAKKSVEAKTVHRVEGDMNAHAVTLDAIVDMNRIAVQMMEQESAELRKQLRAIHVVRVADDQGQTLALYREGKAPAEAKLDSAAYRIRGVKGEGFKLVAGGEVVGRVPEGLPSIGLPKMSWDMLGSLLSAAIVISLVGFMEAISIAKAIAAKTKQKIDPNQELIGQGLANLVGSMTQAFPVSGSFSRSAVNMNSGAKTGMSSVITGLIVLVTLLFLTPLLYHLPQAVLAAVIIMAVIGLINFSAIKHAWAANKHDGIASVVTFLATLAFAPHLDKGIMVGAGLALVLYLYRTMSPRVAILGRAPDGSLRDVKVFDLPPSDVVTAVRFDGNLYFANVAYFEDAILEAVANNPRAPYLLIVGNGINELDASGEEIVHHLVERMRGSGVVVLFSGVKKQVIDVMKATGLFALIGEKNIFPTADQALEKIYSREENFDAADTLRPASVPALMAEARFG